MKIGWAEESITPDRKVRLAGQFFERISEYVSSGIAGHAAGELLVRESVQTINEMWD